MANWNQGCLYSIRMPSRDIIRFAIKCQRPQPSHKPSPKFQYLTDKKINWNPQLFITYASISWSIAIVVDKELNTNPKNFWEGYKMPLKQIQYSIASVYYKCVGAHKH